MSQFAITKHSRPPQCQVREEKNSTIQYAVASCPCESNEDKNFACLNHLDSKNESFASMSVFDGHGGPATAQLLSAQYNDCMVRHVLNLQRAFASLQSTKGDSDEMLKALMDDLQGVHVHDAIICEATRRACVEMDKMAKKTTDTGSTLVSLFVANQQGSTGTRKNLPSPCTFLHTHLTFSIYPVHTPSISFDRYATRVFCTILSSPLHTPSYRHTHLTPSTHPLYHSTGTRVFCTNLGDSRCIMLRACDLKDALNKSGINHSGLPATTGPAGGALSGPTTLAHQVETTAQTHRLAQPPSAPGIAPTTTPTTRSRKFGSFSLSSSSTSNAHSSSASGKADAVQYFTAVHLMSEDHKLSVLRERMRVKTRTPVLPTLAIHIPSHTHTYTLSHKHTHHSTRCYITPLSHTLSTHSAHHGLPQVEWRRLPADASAIFLPDFCRAVAPESFLPMRSYMVDPPSLASMPTMA